MTTKKLPIYDSHAAAAYLGLSSETIRRYVQRGILVPSQRVGRAYVFDHSELNRYANSRKSVGRPPRR